MTIELRPRLRAVGAAAGGWLRASSYLQRWLVLGAAIGVIAGTGAVVVYAPLRTGTHLLLGDLGGYRPPTYRSSQRPLPATENSFGSG